MASLRDLLMPSLTSWLTVQSALSAHVHDHQVGGAVNVPEGRAATEKNLDRLEKWQQEPHEVQQNQI